jgi:hypothetical protein
VIARIWTARTTPANASPYADYLQQHVFTALREMDGYDGVEVQVITLWHSLDAIRAFAGADSEAAVVTGAAAALLTDFDRRARHFEVVLQDEAP